MHQKEEISEILLFLPPSSVEKARVNVWQETQQLGL